jgi:Zn-dependent protease
VPSLSELAPRLLAAALLLGIALPVHEFSHALAADRLGDRTARLFGRLTLNPAAHFDPLGGMLLLITLFLGVGFGWAKPTPVNPLNLRAGKWGEAIVAAAGPGSNLVMAVLGGLVLRLLVAANAAVPYEIYYGIYFFAAVNVLLMVFNLIPIPPLDGSKVLYSFLNPRTAWQLRPTLEQYGPLALLVAIFLPIFPGGQTFIGVVFDVVVTPLLGLIVG